MTKFFDAMDGFFDRYFSGLWGWALVILLGVVVVVLERITSSSTPMLLLALPGIYIIGRTGGIYSIVRFALCIAVAILVLTASINFIGLSK